MTGPLFLLYCTGILAAVLCGAQSSAYDLTSSQNPATAGQKKHSNSKADTISSPAGTHVASSMSATLVPTTVSQDSNSPSTSPGPQSTTTTTTTSTSTSTTSSSSTSTSTPIDKFYKKECLPVFMTAGGLIIACTIFLISTLLLMCKVCRLRSHIKMLSDNADLISTSEYWMGTAKRSKSAQETDAKETIVLMADIGQTQGDVEEGEAAKANEDGPMGEEDQKEEGDTAPSGEASTTPAVGDASSSEPQGEANDSQAVKAGAAPSSKSTEEPKEV